MGKKKTPLPKSELEIARIVWKLGEATVRQVADELPRDVDFWTVQTYLRRLAEKGYLKKRKEGGANVYSAAVKPDSVVSEALNDLVERLFDGEALPLFQHLISDRGLSRDEIDQLQSTLDQLKAKKPRKKS